MEFNYHEFCYQSGEHLTPIFFTFFLAFENSLTSFSLCIHSNVCRTISASLVRVQMTNATSSSTDAEPSKRNRHWSHVHVVPSSLVRIFSVSRFVVVWCNNKVHLMSMKVRVSGDKTEYWR